MIEINITKFIEQKRIENNKKDANIIFEYKKCLCKLEKISKKLNKQYESKKDDHFFETEIFKLNDNVANILKNIIKFGLASQNEINEIMNSKKPVQIRVR